MAVVNVRIPSAMACRFRRGSTPRYERAFPSRHPGNAREVLVPALEEAKSLRAIEYNHAEARGKIRPQARCRQLRLEVGNSVAVVNDPCGAVMAARDAVDKPSPRERPARNRA